MIRQAYIPIQAGLRGGEPIDPLRPLLGRPVIEHVILHLAAFGARTVTLGVDDPDHGVWAAYEGRAIGNAEVRVGEAPPPEPVLVADPAPILCDLAAFVSPPPASRRLLTAEGAPAGYEIRAGGAMAEAVGGDGVDLRTADEAALIRPAAFLDRDGVINIDHGYTFRPDDLAFTPTAVAGIRRLNRAGYRVLVVTNQSGVARGLYAEADVHAFHDHLQAALLAEGAHIDGFYHCAYHPEGSVAAYAREHEDRKPGAGMLLRAMRDWPVARERSVMFGDKASDMAAAAAADVHGILIEANVGDLDRAVSDFLGQREGAAA